MKDRISQNPGRVLITPEDGDAAFYATMTRADNPTQNGDPLNKNTLLTDATAALLGGDETMLPDDAFVALKTLIDGISAESIGAAKIETGSFTGTGKAGLKLTFGFTPKVVLVTASGIGSSALSVFYCMFYGVTEFPVLVGSSTYGPFSNGVAWSGNTATLSFYSNNGGYYSNCSGVKYTYVAFG